MDYETKIYSLIIKPTKEPIFSEMATTVSIEDDAGGMYFTISQDRARDNTVAINPDEWPHIVAAMERLMAEWPDDMAGRGE